MRLMGFLAALILGLVSSQASDLQCVIRKNDLKILQALVKTQRSRAVLIGLSEGVEAFVTEKENQMFMIEAYVPESDARIYAEGSLLRFSDKLSATIWSRKSLIDLECLPK